MKGFRIILLCMAALAVLSASQACRREPEPQRDFYSEVKSVRKLVLARMCVTKMASVDDIDPSKAENLREMAEGILDAVKPGARKAVYSYDTTLQAYIDLSELSRDDVVVDSQARTVTVTLPPVKVEVSGRDAGIREEHYRVTGLRSNINAAERAQIKERMSRALSSEIESRPAFRERLEAEARMKAESWLTALLGSDGDFTVNVRFRNRPGHI